VRDTVTKTMSFSSHQIHTSSYRQSAALVSKQI